MTPEIRPIARSLHDHQVDRFLVGGVSERLRGAVRPADAVDRRRHPGPGQPRADCRCAQRPRGRSCESRASSPVSRVLVEVRITPRLLAQGQTQWWTPHGNLDILPTSAPLRSRTMPMGDPELVCARSTAPPSPSTVRRGPRSTAPTGRGSAEREWGHSTVPVDVTRRADR